MLLTTQIYVVELLGDTAFTSCVGLGNVYLILLTVVFSSLNSAQDSFAYQDMLDHQSCGQLLNKGLLINTVCFGLPLLATFFATDFLENLMGA